MSGSSCHKCKLRDLSTGQKVGKGEKPGFFQNWPTSQLQEKAGFLFTITFFVLYTA